MGLGHATGLSTCRSPAPPHESDLPSRVPSGTPEDGVQLEPKTAGRLHSCFLLTLQSFCTDCISGPVSTSSCPAGRQRGQASSLALRTLACPGSPDWVEAGGAGVGAHTPLLASPLPFQ